MSSCVGPIPPVVKQNQFFLKEFTFLTIIFSISSTTDISLHSIPISCNFLHRKLEFVSNVLPDKTSLPIIIIPDVFLFYFHFIFYYLLNFFYYTLIFFYDQ